ncbi:MAG TPA: SUMF1/EgtB/PvdO family nonheme iron enzyme, partial [Thermoanaerobaculia bacterium]|nr:SUMF1/EgtB/PvdO family nonheme iron enzyme [Thermoanaerobaculia bacterium]
ARSRHIRIAAALLLALLAAGAWLVKRTLDVRKARATLPEIERLMADGRYFEAWDLAESAQVVLGSDERLVRALQAMSEPLTVESKPPGAEVFLERVLPDGSTGARRLVGATPLVKHPIARGNYILSVEKIGFAPLRRPVSAQPLRVAGTIIPQPPPPFELTLLESSKVPEGMVHVEGGPYRLTGWMPVTDASVKLDSFFIDQYEVSNADFERFVRAGGYRRREWWKHPFEKDGRTLSFEEAMPLLRDATGLPGPRSWAQSRPPHGRENYPVTGITWYEAAAYAEFAGKKLPTIYQWDKAARNGRRAFAGSIFPWGMTEPGGDVTARVNFRGGGPMPVDSLAAGMSMWGVHHLAGNVSEMLRNRNNDGFAATGGAFDDPTYEFSAIGAYPGFFSSPKLGFRCVREVSPRGDQGAFALATTKVEVPPFTPVGDAEYARLLRHYDYDRTPLDVKPLERVDAPDWVREKVSFTGARGKTAFAYLYLPKSARPPYQVIHYLPAADVGHGRRSLPMSIEQAHAAIIRSGRAFFGVVLEGYMERRSDDAAAPPDGWNEAVDHTIDLRRGLDYLASRPDIASDKIGFLSPSADFALIITAIDDRYDAAAYIGSRFRPGDVAPHLERGNFVPRIKPPKLVMHGRYDEVNSLKTEAEPLVALMRGQKTLLPYDGGHIPVGDWAIPQLIQWYDSVLGPVTQ